MSVDLNSGHAVVYDETLPEDIRLKAVMSSGSVEAMFPLVEIGDYALGDGGIFANTPLVEAIQKCRDFGFEDDKILIDVIMCQNNVLKLN